MIEVNLVDTMWVLVACCLVFLMHLGFSAIEAGFTRSKNTVSIIMKNITTILVGSIVFYIIGFSLSFSGSGPIIGDLGAIVGRGIGTPLWDGLTIPGIVFFLFQMMFAATCATIVSGAVAERIKYSAYVIISAVLVALIYPTVAHWVWGGGWLSGIGFIDFAGSTVVHSVGGWAALASAIVLGPRIGKFTSKGIPRAIAGHDIGLACIGLFILWVGWFGFNGGSALQLDSSVGTIVTTTYLASIAGGLSTLAFTWATQKKPDVSMMMNGILAGLVAVTASCASIEPYWALVIGGVAGVLVTVSVNMLETRFKIDDPVGAISVHGVNGLWGTLATGLFAQGSGLITAGKVGLLGTQALGALVVFLFVFPLSYGLALVIKKTIGIRVEAKTEIRGLDTIEFGGDAYPDFIRT